MTYRSTIKFKDLTIALYDPWHLIVLTKWDLIVMEKTNITKYVGRNIPVLSIIPITSLEDPAYHLHGGNPSTIRQIKKCPVFDEADAILIDNIIESGCYIGKNKTHQAPSFLDRLEGRKTISSKYLDQSMEITDMLGIGLWGIGLESLLNLDYLSKMNTTVRYNNTQVDYLYYQDIYSNCRVKDMNNQLFRIDIQHAFEYGLAGLECDLILSNKSGMDDFSPASMTVPIDSTLQWFNPDEYSHKLIINPDVWSGEKDLPATSTLAWDFNEAALYRVVCITDEHGLVENKISVIDN